MDEKTEELREIFTSVTDGADTVTESQEDTRGSLEKDERTIAERLDSLITQMLDRYEFETELSVEELRQVATGFYEQQSDSEIADDIDVEEDVVFDARMSLHLIDDADVGDIDLATLRNRDEDNETLAEEYDSDRDQIRRYRRVAIAQDESRRANDRYRDEFDSILADSELSSRMATDVREDGLDDATEGMETDVSF